MANYETLILRIKEPRIIRTRELGDDILQNFHGELLNLKPRNIEALKELGIQVKVRN